MSPYMSGYRNTSLVLRIPSSYSNHRHDEVPSLRLSLGGCHSYPLCGITSPFPNIKISLILFIFRLNLKLLFFAIRTHLPGKCQERQQYPPMRSRLHRQLHPLVGKGGCGTPLMCLRKKDDFF